MKRSGFAQRIRDSLLQPAEVVRQTEDAPSWRYFFLLTLLLSLLTLGAMFLYEYPMGGLDETLTALDRELADFSLRDGRLTADIDEPVLLSVPGVAIVVDMRPESTALEEIDPGQVVYFFGPERLVVSSGGQRMPVDYGLLGWELDKSGLLELIRGWAWVWLLVTGLLLFAGLSVSGLVYALIIAAIALGLCLTFGAPVPFARRYAMALRALTGVFLTETAFTLVNLFAGTAVRLPALASYAVTLVFMGFYLHAVKQELEPPDEEDEDS
jgi:hypothetical protein